MSIASFIRDTVLRPRLLQAGCMVVYDPDNRYYDLCLGLSGDRIRFIDASESSIESRHDAIMALREVGKTKREMHCWSMFRSRAQKPMKKSRLIPSQFMRKVARSFPKMTVTTT